MGRRVHSLFAFPGILALHAIGMGFAVGISVALDLRILGVAQAIPWRDAPLRADPVGRFWLNAVSGVLLLIGYPTKALTNPVFYLKLLLIAAAMVLLTWISRRRVRERRRAPRPTRTPPSPARVGGWRSSRWCAGPAPSLQADCWRTRTRVSTRT